eukprot:Clim_evm15s200 gene=Clim_evmTU15s200
MSSDAYTPMADRPVWSDVQPMEQPDDGSIVAINYDPDYVDVMNYFRAVVKSEECSQRVFDLTTELIDFNPANYTAWQVRRDCLQAVQPNLTAELEYIADMASENPKNYQIWHHRRVIIEWTKDASLEKAFCRRALNADAKNYHAWQHRQWAVSTFELWDGELEYCDELLEDDVRNNSAWNHRYFVINATESWEKPDVAQREIDYAIRKLAKTPNNESAWNYLRGIAGDLTKYPSLVETTRSWWHEKHIPSPYLADFVALTYGAEAAKTSDTAARKAAVSSAREILESLSSTLDPVRKKYWEWRMKQLPALA